MRLSPVYAIVDGDVLRRRGLPLPDAAEGLLEGGIRLLQLRWKADFDSEIFETARIIQRLCLDAGAKFVLNDRADIAVLLGDDTGVHVGQLDLTPADVRVVAGPKITVGISTHNEAQFAQAIREPVDYVAIGPICQTSSKERPDPVVGVSELQRLRSLYSGPLVAIGGITRDRAREVWNAGADSIAVISDLFPVEDCSKATVRARAEEWVGLAPSNERK